MIRLILLVATFITTYFVGEWTSNSELYPNAGLWYAVPLMTILLGHEMGHYLTCRYYHVRATLPIFLPMPLPPFGTLGAVIMMRSPMPNRRAIFDIGIAGPLVGLLLSVPAIIIGLHMSKMVDAVELIRYYATHHQWTFFLGEPQIFKWAQHWLKGPVPEGMALDFHPLAFAGWVGLFVTVLNLIPVGQLDGGHILYALFRRRSVAISHVVVTAALALAVIFLVKYHFLWEYTVFVVLAFVLSHRFPHPAPMNEFHPIGAGRKGLAVVMLALLAVCFTPRPLPQVWDKETMQEYLEQQEEKGPPPMWTPEDVERWTRKV